MVVLVGGQTGAGKTAITQMIKDALAQRGGYLNINMDYYNPHHPDYARLRAADESTASAYVRADGDVWWTKAQEYAIAGRHDVVLETAMFTRAEYEDIAARFRAAGYRVDTAIVAVPEATSRLGVLGRFWSEVVEVGHGRYIERAGHDATYAGVMRAAAALDAGRLSDNVFVFRRGGEVIYHNHLDADGQWARPARAAEALQAERTRLWTEAEQRWFDTNVERLRNEIDPRWRPEVDEIAELGRRHIPPERAADSVPRALPPAPDAGPPARVPGPEPDAGPRPDAEPTGDARPEPRAEPAGGRTAEPEPTAPVPVSEVADALRGEAPPVRSGPEQPPAGRAEADHPQERPEAEPEAGSHDGPARPLPTDPVSGYRLQQRDLDFLGLTEGDFQALRDREAPLGMTPEQYRNWAASLYEALRLDGVAPDQVDIRIRGSSTDVFSGAHKRMPTLDELADSPEAAGRLRAWLGDDPERPTSRPFDAMHRLGLEEPSDYDINISSRVMFERSAAAWDERVYDGPMVKDHGYLRKELVAFVFPHLAAWASEQQAIVDRDMSYALFGEHGPADSTHLGFFVHFRDSDFIVRPPDEVDPGRRGQSDEGGN